MFFKMLIHNKHTENTQAVQTDILDLHITYEKRKIVIVHAWTTSNVAVASLSFQ